MASNRQFDWSRYVRIDRGFTDAERTVIEQALGDIARFRDGEGMALMRRAYELRGGRIRIERTSDNSVYWGGRRIGIDLGEACVNRWLNNGGDSRPGLVPVLVHELYHAADSKDDINEQARQVLYRLLRVENGSVDAARLQHMLRQIRPDRNVDSDADGINHILTGRRGMLSDVLRHYRLETLAQRADMLDGATKISALVTSGISYVDDTHLGRDGFSYMHTRYELDATRYTDALMARNYGPDFPQRRWYRALDGTDPRPRLAGLSAQELARLTHYRPLTNGDYATQGFAAQPYAVGDLGQLPPPTVRAHQPSQAVIAAGGHN